MKFSETQLAGLWIIESEPFNDERGSFVKTYCAREFAASGADVHFSNTYFASNYVRATLRGLHYQLAPYGEDKLVRCLAGQIFDVAVDLRLESKTYLDWFGIELSAENHRSLFIPRGFAHGFMTLTDNAVVHYQVSNYFEPKAERGVRWDDPAIGIKWPLEPKVISERDKSHAYWLPRLGQ